MLDRKKVIHSDQGIVRDDSKPLKAGVSSTATTSKTDKLSSKPQSNVTGLKVLLRAKRQVGGSSMMSLVKTGDNQGQGAAVTTKRPLMFGAIKKGTA